MTKERRDYTGLMEDEYWTAPKPGPSPFLERIPSPSPGNPKLNYPPDRSPYRESPKHQYVSGHSKLKVFWRERDIEYHEWAVKQLKEASSDMATLVVGEQKVHITCHKILLAYFSDFFLGALYGKFSEANNSVVTLEEEDAKEMESFVSWIYSGQLIVNGINTSEGFWEESGYNLRNRGYYETGPCNVHPAARFWVLGDRLLAHRFCNMAMVSFCNSMSYTRRRPGVNCETAGFVYANTIPGSELRLIVKRLIIDDGPLRPRVDMTQVYPMIEGENRRRMQWVELLAKGGDLVRDCIDAGFGNQVLDNYMMAWNEENWGPYLVSMKEKKSPADWAKEKLGLSIQVDVPMEENNWIDELKADWEERFMEFCKHHQQNLHDPKHCYEFRSCPRYKHTPKFLVPPKKKRRARKAKKE